MVDPPMDRRKSSSRHGERDNEELDDRDLARHGSRERRKEEKEERNRDKHRDKDYEKDKQRERDRDRDRGREHGRERGKEREKDREADREKEKSHDHVGHRDKYREREVDRNLERERVKEKVRERGKEREKDRERTKDRDLEREKVSDRERGKERERDKGKERQRGKDEDQGLEASKDGSVNTEIKGGFVGSKEERKIVDRSDDAEDEDGSYKVAGSKDLSNKSKEVGSYESSSDLTERLRKMKEERLKNASDSSSDIASWVSRSRKLEQKRSEQKEKARSISKASKYQDNELEENEDEDAIRQSRKDLAGVKILHGLDKVLEGGAVVLTLKDQSIIADGDINEDADVLENVEIGEQKQRDEAYKAAKKKTGTYDDKFSDDFGSRKPILPQYDDPVEDEGVTLDESGHFGGEAEKKLEELRRRIEGVSASKSYGDLTTSGKISSDYYTAEEMLQFKKPKKKKSLRKKEKLDLDALEAEAVSAGLGAGDLGSRKDAKRQAAKEETERAAAEKRTSAYQAAYAKAEEASRILRQEQTLTVKTEEEEELIFGDDYEDLQKSLEQARKLALKKQEEAAASGPQAVAQIAVESKDQGSNQESTGGGREENKLVITEMEEFVLGLQLNEDTHKPEEEDVFMDDDDAPTTTEQPMEEDPAQSAELKQANEHEPVKDEKEDIAADEIIHEAAVGKGLAGALKLLKDRGTLKDTIDLGGRNMDKKKSKLVGVYDTEGTKEIRIERTDEFGRIMTPKEAFRRISHKFHGKGPGKMKQEKRMKQYQEDLKAKQMKASDTPLLAMERMMEAQTRLKTPYIVISGHVKPGQTSDPNSGFATVEKDHLGSLTPMLGDKKVEHFLGIKRKSDAGSMGPPPPKKPKN